MSSEILDPDKPLTRSDARMIAGLSDPAKGGKQWVAQLTERHRQAIVGKVVASINALSVSDRNDQKILARLTMVLARFDALDMAREQGPAQNNHLHLHGDVATMNANELRAYIASRLGSGDPEA